MTRVNPNTSGNFDAPSYCVVTFVTNGRDTWIFIRLYDVHSVVYTDKLKGRLLVMVWLPLSVLACCWCNHLEENSATDLHCKEKWQKIIIISQKIPSIRWLCVKVSIVISIGIHTMESFVSVKKFLAQISLMFKLVMWNSPLRPTERCLVWKRLLCEQPWAIDLFGLWTLTDVSLSYHRWYGL